MWRKILTVAVFPVYKIFNAVSYANTRPSWMGKVLTFATFLPIIVMTTVVWFAAWTIVLSLAWHHLAPS